jgi:hypothetical protein
MRFSGTFTDLPVMSWYVVSGGGTQTGNLFSLLD